MFDLWVGFNKMPIKAWNSNNSLLNFEKSDLIILWYYLNYPFL